MGLSLPFPYSSAPETKVKRDYVMCPRGHGQDAAVPGSAPRAVLATLLACSSSWRDGTRRFRGQVLSVCHQAGLPSQNASHPPVNMYDNMNQIWPLSEETRSRAVSTSAGLLENDVQCSPCDFQPLGWAQKLESEHLFKSLLLYLSLFLSLSSNWGQTSNSQR